MLCNSNILLINPFLYTMNNFPLNIYLCIGLPYFPAAVQNHNTGDARLWINTSFDLIIERGLQKGLKLLAIQLDLFGHLSHTLGAACE